MKDLKLPLMSDNISREDLDCLIEFLKQEPIPRDFLPGAFQVNCECKGETKKREGLGGFMVCKGDDPIAAMWLWMTNSKVAFPAVVISDKSYRDTDRSDALQLLIEHRRFS